MIQSDFNILVTNVTAIVNHTFNIQADEFADGVVQEAAQGGAAAGFDTDQHFESFDFQDVLDSGYRDLAELTDELDEAWEQVDRELLQELLAEVPGDMPNLTMKMSGDDLKTWIRHSLQADEETPVYAIHRMIMALFDGSSEQINDMIREAIAFDDLDELIDEEPNLLPENISLENLITAATIQSFNVLAWLIPRADLDDDEALELLESNIDDKFIFQKVYGMLEPDDALKSAIRSRAEALGQSRIVEFLS